MKIAAWSDGHGLLPKLKMYVDVMVICGDIVPLRCQYSTHESLMWFANKFLKYVKKANCKKVIVVPGNHDYLFERLSPKTIKDIIAHSDHDIADKLVYLVDEEYEYKGLKFYGTPWVTSPSSMAFYTNDPSLTYCHIPDDCDILLTHQPPNVDRVGAAHPYQFDEQNFGSDSLMRELLTRNIKYHFCGHCHSGIHDGVIFNKTLVYNVAIMNDATTTQTYDITYIEF